MPTLDKPRYEAFAQAGAKGVRLALLDAARLHGGVADGRRHDQYDIIDEYGFQAGAAAKAEA